MRTLFPEIQKIQKEIEIIVRKRAKKELQSPHFGKFFTILSKKDI
jgi:hypothetical protein